MMKNLTQAVAFSTFFAIIGLQPTAYSAPRIPSDLLDNSLVYCTNASGFSFNPQKADVGTNMNVVTEQIYDKLFEFDPRHNRLKPALATHFQISNDGLTITLTLRKNVQFHQTKWFTPSRAFNADDVVFSLNRVMNRHEELSELDAAQRQENQDEWADRTHFPYFESIDLKSKIARVFAPSPYVVKIELTRPDASLPAYLSSQYAVILSKEYALQLNADDNLSQLDILPVGTGVYQLESYAQNDFARLKPNPHYWGEKAHIENMIVDFSTTGTGRMAKFLNNECDISAFPELSQLSVLNAEQGYLVENQGANLAFLAFNMQQPQMQDIALRRYIAQSIDRQRLAKVLFYGAAQVAQGVLPAALMADFRPIVPNEAAANLPEKPLNRPLVLWVIDEKRVYGLHPLKMAEFIRHELVRAGLKVNVRPVSRAFLVQQLEQGSADYDLILSGWLANNFDPDNFLTPILSCQAPRSVTNLANWCEPIFDQLLHSARLSENSAQRQMLYQQADDFLQKNLPIVPLVSVNRVLIVNNEIENVRISPFGQVNLSRIRVK
ncbi:ABC transporter substrate-binding protein [Muribacter muris]|nr:ABC transporter substrate-binding protein [Muribacter muris]MBF0785669.1 ABC transporter substrate-binding protein [Muribacter muris]MBF0828340.1 ABC transporter substrate-binding protein [Muribacter muris]